MARGLAKRAFQMLESYLLRQGYRMSWAPSTFIRNPQSELSFELEFLIAHLMLSKPSPFFVQIGANDGISNDPLHKFIVEFDLEGILLEPLPEIFEKLSAAYAGNKRLHLLNAALAEKDGWRTMYTARIDGDVFSKAHQFSSFRRASLLSQTRWIPDIATRVDEKQVKCVSFDSLMREARHREIEILQMDAEGYDFDILKMIDFTRLKPAIIGFEHGHMTKDQQDEIAKLLFGQNYRLVRGNMDTLAYRPVRTFGFR